MAVDIILFRSPEVDDCSGRGPEPLYSQVWAFLEKNYGAPKADSYGSLFRGKKGETVVLTDNSLSNFPHQLVLVDTPKEIISGLENILGKQKDLRASLS